MEFGREEMGLEMDGFWVFRWLWRTGGQEERTKERDSMTIIEREREREDKGQEGNAGSYVLCLVQFGLSQLIYFFKFGIFFLYLIIPVAF